MAGHPVGSSSRPCRGSAGLRMCLIPGAAGERGWPPPRISFTVSACGIAGGAPAWVQLSAGHPEKGTLAPREAAPRRLRGPGGSAASKRNGEQKGILR